MRLQVINESWGKTATVNNSYKLVVIDQGYQVAELIFQYVAVPQGKDRVSQEKVLAENIARAFNSVASVEQG